MGALLDELAAHGVRVEPSGDGNVRAHGPLTDNLRTAIRTHKPAILPNSRQTMRGPRAPDNGKNCVS